MSRSNCILLPMTLIALALALGCDRGGDGHAAHDDDDHADHAGHEDHDDHDHPAGGHAEAPKREPGHVDEHGHAHEGEHEGEPAGEAEHAEEVTLAAEAVKHAGIRIDRVGRHAMIDTVTAPARVAFNAEGVAHVGSPLAGRVAQIMVRVGDTVAKGDPLLVVQSPDLGEAQSDYLVKRMAVETAAHAVEFARSAHERAKALYDESQGIAMIEVQQREAEHKSTLGAHLSAQAQATAAENRLHLLGMDQPAVVELVSSGEIAPQLVIRAPIAGQVIEREATIGELVSPEREALLVLADMSTLWVLADVPESRMSQVAVGSQAQVAVPALSGRKFEGAVAFVAPMLDPGTRTATVRIEVKGPAPALRPGMFVQAVITQSGEGGAHEPVLAIPEEATQLVEGQIVVFVPVPGEENTFAKRPVRLGPAVGRMVPVLSGLKEGEPFVATGSFILKAEHGKAGAEHQH